MSVLRIFYGLTIIRFRIILSNQRKTSSQSERGKQMEEMTFEEFSREHTTTENKVQGTGLGLSITKEIIQAHNENINVISTEGVGSEFIFSLPVQDNEA